MRYNNHDSTRVRGTLEISMSKLVQYLQEHITGEVIDTPDARDYFSTDASIFRLSPAVIVYPRSTTDVRKVARFTWQLADRGKVIPITARGSGTDLSGGAIGSGIMVVFPAHMHKVMSFDSGKGIATVQPGINFDKLQQALHIHGRFLPPYPASINYSTIGGSVANNAAGEKTVKYGTMSKYVKGLEVVLANGDVITTGRLNRRELRKKKELKTFEGEIYRTLDDLLEHNSDTVANMAFGPETNRPITKNTSGYALASIKQKDGSFDLTPLFVGSQGTLGIVTEITLETESYNPTPLRMGAVFDEVSKAAEAVQKILKLKPSALEMVDKNLLEFVGSQNHELLSKILTPPYAAITLLIEFDESSAHKRKSLQKKVERSLIDLASSLVVPETEQEHENLWKIRDAVSVVWTASTESGRAVPIVDDAVVAPTVWPALLDHIYSLSEQYGITPAVWGHVGDGNLHFMPIVDLSSDSSKQKLLRFMHDYYKGVLKLGGSTSGQHNDGRLRAMYVRAQYGEAAYTLMIKVKQLFDPHSTLNPGVKMSTSVNDIVSLINPTYRLDHMYDHLPKT